jgi:hypothetical protein
VLVAGCSSMSPIEKTQTLPPRSVTMVGCVQRAPEAGRFVLRGLALDDQVVAHTGPERGEVPSTETLPGGDAIRTSSDLTPEEWASRVTPLLVGPSADRLSALVDHRVVVTGSFVPARVGGSLDRVKVRTLSQVSPHCIDR